MQEEQLRELVQSLREDLAIAKADGDPQLQQSWLQRKVARQRAALSRLQQRVENQRAVLRKIEELGRGLTQEELAE